MEKYNLNLEVSDLFISEINKYNNKFYFKEEKTKDINPFAKTVKAFNRGIKLESLLKGRIYLREDFENKTSLVATYLIQKFEIPLNEDYRINKETLWIDFKEYFTIGNYLEVYPFSRKIILEEVQGEFKALIEDSQFLTENLPLEFFLSNYLRENPSKIISITHRISD